MSSDKPSGSGEGLSSTNSEASSSSTATGVASGSSDATSPGSTTLTSSAKSQPLVVTITAKEVLENALHDFLLLDTKQINPLLHEVLENISITGRSLFAWDMLKPLLLFQLSISAEKYPNAKDNTENLQRIIGTLSNFDEAPFTLQRIVELAINPEKFYKSSRKFLFALEKLVNVITTVPVWDPSQETNEDETMGDVSIPESVFIDEALSATLNTAEVVPMDVVG